MTNRQRVFDFLAGQPDTWADKQAILDATRIPHDSLIDALTELGAMGLIIRRPAEKNGERGRRWIFRMKPGAERPVDRRAHRGD